MNIIARKLGGWLSRYLSRESKSARVGTPTHFDALRQCVQPCDVILVEGHTKFSTAIKYLTQSTWSHTTLYLGTIEVNGKTYHEQIIEADITDGIVHAHISKLKGYPLRVCRPVGLTEDDAQVLRDYALSKIGGSYDLRNVFDLVRYLLPVIPFPSAHRRKLLMFGSGEPTKAICSTLVAEVFEKIRYPILPNVTKRHHFHQRNHSLFTPRDFDVSPYFQIIKPTIEQGFEYRALEWD